MKFLALSSPYFRRDSCGFLPDAAEGRVLCVPWAEGKGRDRLEGPLAVLKFF